MMASWRVLASEPDIVLGPAPSIAPTPTGRLLTDLPVTSPNCQAASRRDDPRSVRMMPLISRRRSVGWRA